MELFRITCVTCRAGLSVRNESLIGQIVACPKCGSMVQVTAPEPETPQTEAEAIAVETDVGTSYALVAWSTGALAVAAAVFGAVLLWPSAPETSDAAPPVIVEKPVVEDAPPAMMKPEEPAPIAVVEQESTEPQPPPVPPQETADEEEQVAEAPPEDAKPQAEAAPVQAPRVARRFDALALDPEDVDLAALDRSDEKSAERSDDAPPPSPAPAASTEPAARRGAAPERNPALRDAEKQFARKLPTLSVKEMPLADFLALMSQLGGVPVSVAPEHLLMAGLSPRTPISLNARDKTLDEVLTQALERLRLEHEFHGPQVIVVRKGADQVREIEYPVDDLNVEPEQLAESIELLIAPASWKTATLKVDGDVLRIAQAQRVHYQTLVFLERLRLVTGQTPRSKYPVQRLAPTPLGEAMAERLTAPVLFTFSRETPLAEVLQYWQQEIDVPLLVDWPALAELELWPESTIVCAVEDKTWDEALSEALAPLGLDWRATFGGAIEISTAEKLTADPQLELYPVMAAKVDMAALRQKLALHSGELVLDRDANVLIALQPASAQRQILAWLTAQSALRKP